MNTDELLSLGLVPEDIALHQKRIKQTIKGEAQASIPIKDTCRLENGGILPARYITSRNLPKAKGYVSFVPAAGAASRYLKIFNQLIHYLEAGNLEKAGAELLDLRAKGLEQWSLPEEAKKILAGSAADCEKALFRLKEILRRPKAIQPFNQKKETFVGAKSAENKLISGVSAEVFIIPPHQQAAFAQELQSMQSSKPLLFLEQGSQLSTIRFDETGAPFRDEKGLLSAVPAGHGTLAKLVPAAKARFSDCHSVFIRNIDNVLGTSNEVLEHTESFLCQHQFVLSVVKQIRSLLNDDELSKADECAAQLLDHLNLAKVDRYHDFLADEPANQRHLWDLQIKLFQCHPPSVMNYFNETQCDQLLKLLYHRPVNSLGQVPNSGKDVGGTPVLADTEVGAATLCLEVPHANMEDKAKYLADPTKATHFNPVFVAAEMFADPEVYLDRKSPFWILAKKHFGTHTVLYHETVLYELLGNSLMANVMFPEIPRILFNPHKSIEDTAGH